MAEIEFDCSFAITSIQSSDEYLGPDAAVVAECKQLSLDFSKLTFNHCYREANQVADKLAKHSYNSRSPSVWDDVMPDFISHLLVNDMTII